MTRDTGWTMTSKEEALAALDVSPVRAGQHWKHANGHIYKIIGTGIAEATLSPVVIYAGSDGVVWVRGLEVFLGNNDEGKQRFELVPAPDMTERLCCLASRWPGGQHALDCASRGSLQAQAQLTQEFGL